LVETYPTAPAEDADRVKTMKADERLAYFRDWARKQARQERINGIVILVCKSPSVLYVDVTESAKSVVTAEEEKKLREALLAAFREKKYDDGLAAAVRLAGEAFAGQRP
jgi:uncharacterized membrane protein YgcG